MTKDGRVPLHVACRRGDLDMVNLLLEFGADPDIVDSFGYSPVMWSALYGSPLIWKLFMSQNSKDKLSHKSVESLNIKQKVTYRNTSDISDISYKNMDNSVNEKQNIDTLFKKLEEYGISLVQKLGSGQFGDVWKGTQKNKSIAVKFLQKASEKALEELIEELSLLGYVKFIELF
jgi:hypothetical protein